jgi:hypothetical protein
MKLICNKQNKMMRNLRSAHYVATTMAQQNENIKTMGMMMHK